jgi:hypothetical protein
MMRQQECLQHRTSQAWVAELYDGKRGFTGYRVRYRIMRSDGSLGKNFPSKMEVPRRSQMACIDFGKVSLDGQAEEVVPVWNSLSWPSRSSVVPAHSDLSLSDISSDKTSSQSWVSAVLDVGRSSSASERANGNSGAVTVS